MRNTAFDNFVEFLIVSVLVVLLIFLGILLGSNYIRNSAINNNVAYYMVNPKTGDVTFTWATNCNFSNITTNK